MKPRRKLEQRVLLGILTVLCIGSIITAIANVEARWQVPLIFLALITIIRLVTPVEEIHSDVRYLRELSASARISPYPSLDAFYSDLRHALGRAKYTLDLTHIRDNPPDDFGDHTAGWFDAVAEWVQKDSSRSVRRLVSVRNDRMYDWVQQLASVAVEIPRFQVRVVKWDIDAPAINMAIIDGNVVFLAVTGEMLERTRGIAVEDQAVAHYFTDYYNNLWRSAMPLASYLAKKARPTKRRPAAGGTAAVEERPKFEKF